MLNWDREFKRLKATDDDFRGANQGSFRYQAIGKQFTIVANGDSGTIPVDFPNGGVILGARLGVAPVKNTQALNYGAPKLWAVRVSMEFPGGEGSIIVGGRMLGSALFGSDGELVMPAAALKVVRGGQINVVIENMTTTQIVADLVFHSMVRRGR